MMIRNANRNISVAVGHGYTLQKVKFAVNFVQKSGRNTTIQDWVDAYNYIKDANENAQGCQACKAAKFTAAVRNYARYGYMTLLNEGYKPEDFVEGDKPVKVDEISSVTQAETDAASSDVERVVSEPSVELPVVDVQPEQDGIVDVESEEFTETEPVDAESQEETVEQEPVEVVKPKRGRKTKK